MSEPACPKCEQPYSLDNPPKRLINCPHNLCLACLQQEILCPIDRKRIERRKYTLEAFQDDQEVLAALRPAPPIALSARSAHEVTPKPLARNSQSQQRGSQEDKKGVAVAPVGQFQVNQPSPVRVPSKNGSPSMGKGGSKTPKKGGLQFDTCLLHSKRADLVCLEDRCLICANCGLFGEHKQHSIMAYDDFLAAYSKVTEECLLVYGELQEREEKLSGERAEEMVVGILREKREREVKGIRMAITGLVDQLRKLEKEMIATVDQTVTYKQSQMMGQLRWEQLHEKKANYQATVDQMSQGIEEVLNLDNIQKYIPYVVDGTVESFVAKEGEYLILEIDNYWRELERKAQEEADQFTVKVANWENIEGLGKLESKDEKEVMRIIDENRKKIQARIGNKPMTTPSRGKQQPTPKHNPKLTTPIPKTTEDVLLIGTNSNSGSKHSPTQPILQKKHISPIQPVQNFECQIDAQFIQSVHNHSYTQRPEQYAQELRIPQIPMVIGGSLSQHRKTLSTVNRPGLTQQSKREDRKENELEVSRARSRSKLHPNSSNHTTERQLLNVLNEKTDNRSEKKRKKMDLPEKYQKVYEDLLKDKLDVLDLGGAFLGDSLIMAISEWFPTRCRLRTIKLMNNKISDDCFPELLSRCRQVSSLNLSYNCLTEKSLEYLEHEAEELGVLENITLSNNKIQLRSVKDRLEALRKRGLKVSL